jgi:hypothetical protein
MEYHAKLQTPLPSDETDVHLEMSQIFLEMYSYQATKFSNYLRNGTFCNSKQITYSPFPLPSRTKDIVTLLSTETTFLNLVSFFIKK